MKEYFAWCCEFNSSSGEGLLAKKFLDKYFKAKKVKILLPKKRFFFKKVCLSIHRYSYSLVLLFKGEKNCLYKLFTSLEFSNFHFMST